MIFYLLYLIYHFSRLFFHLIMEVDFLLSQFYSVQCLNFFSFYYDFGFSFFLCC
ncbi:hypothetical protein U3516DRAFT_910853 [Neocallimastix sp. 'constans']